MAGVPCNECRVPIARQSDDPVVFNDVDTGEDVTFHGLCVPDDLRAILDAHTREVGYGG